MKKRALPRYVSRFLDRHGKPRYKGRRKGWPDHAFKAAFGTPEFEVELQRWLTGETSKPEVGSSRTIPKSVSHLVVLVYRRRFATLAPSTQATYRGIIERFRAEHGRRFWPDLQERHVRALVEAKSATPAAANNLLRMLHIMAEVAIEEGWRSDDPTARVKKFDVDSDGHVSWTEDDIATFQARWPIGTRARLALELMLWTAARRSDAVRLGRQHVRNGRIDFTQKKTRVPVSIPIHPELRAALDASTIDDRLTFLSTEGGASFSVAGFGNWFRECCDSAGLRGLSAHGLRKAMGRRLAEAGCSAHEIMAILGHTTLKEAQRYCDAANKRMMSGSAMARLGANQEQELSNLEPGLDNASSKSLKSGG